VLKQTLGFDIVDGDLLTEVKRSRRGWIGCDSDITRGDGLTMSALSAMGIMRLVLL